MNLNVVEYPYLNSADLFSLVAHQEWAIFLDSGVVNATKSVTKHADYDVLAIQPNKTLVFDGQQTIIKSGHTMDHLTGDPISHLQSSIPKLDELESINTKYAYLPGALGYFSYDLARQYEQLPSIAEDDEQLPHMAIGIYHVIVLVDHIARSTYLLYIGNEQDNESLIKQWHELITNIIDDGVDLQASQHSSNKLVSHSLNENMDYQDYARCFAKVRDYTIEGDCYQVNLAKRFATKVDGDAWSTYVYLRTVSPAPYGAYMNFPFAQVLSNSPESFIQCRDHKVITSPIKGTRPRNHDDAEQDKLIAQTLFNSKKDRAENLMIVDLMRNDLSRCCELGSVKVPHLFAVYSFANVHHLISTVTGTLKADLHSLDLLRRSFPGGSITGAPKIRAMEIIEELEPHRRGLYCGSIGYIGVDGSLETNISIRTIVVKDGVARYAAGGGLVIDSDLNEEYQEILDKASMMKQALDQKEC